MTTIATPEVVDRETWRAAREALLPREKAHTHEGDAIAAARRRLPMTEVPNVELVGHDGPTNLLDIFEGREQLIVYKHMFHIGKPFEEQCEGCTITQWNFQDATYLNEQGVSYAVICEGPWDEVGPFREFMGYSQPWYSAFGVDDPIVGGDFGSIVAFLRVGDRIFATYDTTGRGVEAIMGSLKLLDMTAYGRKEEWEDSPAGWPQEPTGSWWRRDGRPAAQWTRSVE
jgi:predicted dithiol-disulfide oxidoreductase (DUF899 family)